MVKALRIAQAAGTLALVCLLALPWLGAQRLSGRLADGVARLGWSALLAGFGIRLTMRGRPVPGALFVSNHVSWIDIPALARLTGAAFVSKESVGSWPIIGHLARRLGCAFVDRTNPRDAARQSAELARAMRRAQGLVLFPEGTTSEGTGVLPFRSSLFAAVQGMESPVVQPVAILFRARCGRELRPEERPGVAWLDDAALLPHAFALAARGGVAVEVWFEPPVPLADRKQMAEACRRAILARVVPADQAATLNRAA